MSRPDIEGIEERALHEERCHVAVGCATPPHVEDRLALIAYVREVEGLQARTVARLNAVVDSALARAEKAEAEVERLTATPLEPDGHPPSGWMSQADRHQALKMEPHEGTARLYGHAMAADGVIARLRAVNLTPLDIDEVQAHQREGETFSDCVLRLVHRGIDNA